MSTRAGATDGAFWADADDDVALQRYRALVNTVDDGIYQLDAAGRFVAVNDVIVEMTGYAREDLLEEHVSIVLADDDVDRIEGCVAERLATESELTETFEFTAETVDGGAIPCELRMSLLFEDGRFDGTVGVVRDVADRKRTERTLDERETQLQHERDLTNRILETSPVGILVLDAEGEITRINERTVELFEIDDPATFDPSDRDVYAADGSPVAVGDRPYMEVLATGDSVYDRVLRVELSSGESRWRSVNAVPIRNDDGEIDHVVATFEDVTELKERERELSTELEDVFGRISDAFYAVDESFRFTHVNEQAADLLQQSREELLGANLWDVFPSAAEIDDVWDAFHTALETQEPTSYELYYDTLDFWVEANLYPSETGVSVYFRDVTERKKRERELEESERRYRTLAEYFPNGLVTLFDHDRVYTLAAGQGFDRIPVEPADLEGRQFDDVWPDETAADLDPVFQAALEGEEGSVELEYAGREWVVRAAPITDERGDVFAGMTMAQDITEQKERERYLEDSKERLEAATEAGAVGTWEWHVQEDRFVTGASFARTFGVDPAAAREGVPIERLLTSIHEDDRDRVVDRIETAVETCGEYEAEYRVRNADGDIRWVVARGHVECDEDGTAETFPGALTDITERKRAELEVEKRRKEFETLFEVLPVGAVVADADGSLLRSNDTAEEIWGGDVFDADSVPEYEKYAARWAETGEPVEPTDWTMYRVLQGEAVTEPNVYEIDAFDGERRIIMEHGMPVLNDDGTVSRALVTLTDITERRTSQRKLEETVEKLEASNERLEQFAYAASHDLQEPLRMITSYLQLLERRYADAFDADGEEFLEYAVDGADRMREMIDALLEYSRVETQGDPFEPVDLEPVLESVVDTLQLQIEETDAEITIGDLPRVEGDVSQLRQVFQNLLDNALTYSGDEPPQIRVDAERREREWLISVEDEGIGIDPEHQDRIFTVFDRLHGREEYEGTGIGLALCQRIVERHGGEIWVESTPGEGSTFRFTLPATDA